MEKDIELFKEYLRVTPEHQDSFINFLIDSAVISAENYIGIKFGDLKKLSSDLKIALMMHVAEMYENRGEGQMPQSSLNIYNRYKKILI